MRSQAIQRACTKRRACTMLIADALLPDPESGAVVGPMHALMDLQASVCMRMCF